jgi:hypothetical protein
MNGISIVERVGSYADEGENFWQKHIKDFELSGLTQAGYCRKKEINSKRFSYWKKKLSVKQKDDASLNGLPLLAVKIREDVDEKRCGVLGLCSLDFGNGWVLQIHDPRVVELILSRS